MQISEFSIKKKLEDQPEEQVTLFTENAEEDLPANHFSETDLQTEWNAFLNEIQEKDVVIYNAISGFKLRKMDEDTVQVKYPSETAKAEFEKVRADFFNAFKHKVNHQRLQVEFKLDTVNMKKEIVTKRGLFEKYVQINPVLKDLDDLFKFDFN